MEINSFPLFPIFFYFIADIKWVRAQWKFNVVLIKTKNILYSSNWGKCERMEYPENNNVTGQHGFFLKT